MPARYLGMLDVDFELDHPRDRRERPGQILSQI
jgi:hypothetical protein